MIKNSTSLKDIFYKKIIVTKNALSSEKNIREK